MCKYIYILESSTRFARASGPGTWWALPWVLGPGPSPGPSLGPWWGPAGIGPCRGPNKYVKSTISNAQNHVQSQSESFLHEKSHFQHPEISKTQQTKNIVSLKFKTVWRRRSHQKKILAL